MEERRGEEVWNGASKAAEVESSAGEVKPNDGYNGDAQCTRCVGELGTSVEDVEATMAENNTLKLGSVHLSRYVVRCSWIAGCQASRGEAIEGYRPLRNVPP
jgi:hypothetical protein